MVGMGIAVCLPLYKGWLNRLASTSDRQQVKPNKGMIGRNTIGGSPLPDSESVPSENLMILEEYNSGVSIEEHGYLKVEHGVSGHENSERFLVPSVNSRTNLADDRW
jgi:hypothetical protein